MIDLRITKLTQEADGHWSANVSREGDTISVHNRFGSWMTMPEKDTLVMRDVLPPVAARLQERVRLEKGERPKVRR